MGRHQKAGLLLEQLGEGGRQESVMTLRLLAQHHGGSGPEHQVLNTEAAGPGKEDAFDVIKWRF